MVIGYVPPNCTSYCAHSDTPSVRSVAIVVGSGVALILLVWMVKVEIDHRLRTRGTAATAVITAMNGRRVIPHSPDMKVDVTLRVTAPDGGEFSAWTTATLPIVGMPQVGWEVPVRYSARDRQRIALVGDARPPAAESPSHPMER